MTLEIIDTVTDHGNYRGDPAKIAFEKANANFAQAAGPLGISAISGSGLKITLTGANSITVSEGFAYVPGINKVVVLAAPAVANGLAVPAGTYLHGYLYESSLGQAAVEWVTTAMSSPYSGSARTKSGDTSRRYIGSVRSIAANTLAKFIHNPATNSVRYLEDINQSFLRPLVNGVSTTSTNISCSNCVPATARIINVFAENVADSSGALVFISNSESGPAGSANILAFLRTGGILYGELTLDSSQQFNYARAVSSAGGLTVWCNGYVFER